MRSMIAVASLALAGCAASTVKAPPAAEMALYRATEIGFAYQGGRSYYTCDGLAAKISAALKAIGVSQHRPMDLGCSGDTTLRRAQVRINPVLTLPATPENLRSAANYSGRDQLLARVQGRTLPNAAEIPTIPAVWKQVDLSHADGIEDGDCELLQAIRDNLLPALGVRVVSSSLNCQSVGRINHVLMVMALLPVKNPNPSGSAEPSRD